MTVVLNISLIELQDSPYGICTVRECTSGVLGREIKTIVFLLGLLMNTLTAFTLCTITRVEYVAASTTDEMPLWLLYNISLIKL